MLLASKQRLIEQFSGSPVYQKLVIGGAWAFSGKVLAMLTTLVVSALLSRLLAPDELGAYFLIFSMVSTAVFIAHAGLSWTALRLVAQSMGLREPGRAKQVILLTTRLAAIGTLLVAGFLAFGGVKAIAEHVFHSELIARASGMIAILVVLVSIQNFSIEIFRGFHDIRLAILFGNLGSNFFAMLFFWCLWQVNGRGSIPAVLEIHVFFSLILVILVVLLLAIRISKLPAVENSINVKEITSVSLGLWGTHLMLLVWSQADLWVVGSFQSSEGVALYGAAVRLMSIVNLPLIVTNTVLPPIISELHSQNKMMELEQVLRNSATVAALPSLLILVSLIVFNSPILGLLFGEFYRSAGLVLIVLSLGQLVNVWAGSCGLLLMYTGYQNTMMKITMVSAFMTVSGSLIAVQFFGLLGVSFSALIGMCLQNFLALFFGRRKLKIWTHARLDLRSVSF